METYKSQPFKITIAEDSSREGCHWRRALKQSKKF